MYSCFERSRDALFNLSDALLSEPQARSLPELSLSVFFERSFPSVYEALQDGRINVERLRSVFVQALLEGKSREEPIWLGIVSLSMQRLEAESSPDRGMIYVANMPHATKPVSVGWQFSTLMLLPEQRSHWVGILDQCRIASAQTAIEVGIEQLRGLPAELRQRAILLADRWYATTSGCSAPVVSCSFRRSFGSNAIANCIELRPSVRRSNAVRPANMARSWRRTRPETHGPADAEWEGVDEHGKRVVDTSWKGLHFRQAPEVEVSVIRVLREGARDSKRDPRESWFLWTGQQDIPLEQVRTWYRKRFSQEHGYRFRHRKTCSGNRRTCVRHSRVDRWSWIVACACNQLLLAKQLGQALLRPWESTQRAVTPRQVRRVMPSILLQFGTPAQPPKPRGKSPGWPKGRVRTPAPRFAVVRKPKPVPKTHRKRA